MTSNAQAALAAAAQVYQGTEGDVRPDLITGMAYQFKRWLDGKDEEAQQVNQERGMSALMADLTPMPSYLWEVDMTPRNVGNAKPVQVEVWAANEEEAISKAIAAKPGHTWGRPRRYANITPKPSPKVFNLPA